MKTVAVKAKANENACTPDGRAQPFLLRRDSIACITTATTRLAGATPLGSVGRQGSRAHPNVHVTLEPPPPSSGFRPRGTNVSRTSLTPTEPRFPDIKPRVQRAHAFVPFHFLPHPHSDYIFTIKKIY
jgi:hypothetical protein